MTAWDLLLTDVRIATMTPGTDAYGVINDGAIAVRDGRIAWLGPAAERPAVTADDVRSLQQRWVTPALIDCHTHLVYGGDRAAEFEQRLQGVSYEAIAAAGGGILSTVAATRAASKAELLNAASQRAAALLADGVATLEIKSGYGLNLETELKSLQVARELAAVTGQSVRTTLLAAHSVPPEFDGRSDAYVDFICDTILPAASTRQLADAVDAYCERIAFDSEQVARIFARAAELGLPVKLHADQLSDGDGAALAAKFGALSADHLEYSAPAGIAAMAAAGTVAVLLPGAYVTLQEDRPPPVELLRQHQVPMAVATDCNPGTSPLLSVREAMALACRVFGLAPAEALAGATRIAAQALGLAADRGRVAVGLRADLAVWNVEHPRDLCYWLGSQPLSDLFIAGQPANLRRP